MPEVGVGIELGGRLKRQEDAVVGALDVELDVAHHHAAIERVIR